MKALLGNLSDADIRLLRIFMAVARCGGLSAAELELNIGRSTISRHLKDLETRLGITLCHRGRAGFSLTQEGAQIRDAADRLIGSLEDFRNQVNDLHRSLQGSLSIAIFDKTVTNQACRIHQAIAAYLKEAPDVFIRIHIVPVNSIEKGVLDGSYQVGIIPTHRPSTSLEYIRLFGEQMYLYCGREHPLFTQAESITPEIIARQRYAGLDFHSPNMDVSHKLGLNKVATANDQEGIATLIKSGGFIGFLPEHYARVFVHAGEMKRIPSPDYEYFCDFAALYRKSPRPTRLVEHFLQSLRNVHDL
ncbi:LysR family transcriptional regulator [Thalassolituus sp. LLYu03]|uniref:LysR family transcriptional regulator n=1 Tax=Thalassolituus sp. LLYu03 TaxID=3421656 RepID=UPI003D27AFBF